MTQEPDDEQFDRQNRAPVFIDYMGLIETNEEVLFYQDLLSTFPKY